MPVMDFDDKEVMRVSPADGKPLTNFWGYSTHSFFAPKCAYCVSYEEGSHLRDFRDMVKAFHRAGIEVTPKSELVRRTWISTTSLVTHPVPYLI